MDRPQREKRFLSIFSAEFINDEAYFILKEDIIKDVVHRWISQGAGFSLYFTQLNIR
jgi:hypothetical protein